jgi:hypothetical protein
MKAGIDESTRSTSMRRLTHRQNINSVRYATKMKVWHGIGVTTMGRRKTLLALTIALCSPVNRPGRLLLLQLILDIVHAAQSADATGLALLGVSQPWKIQKKPL